MESFHVYYEIDYSRMDAFRVVPYLDGTEAEQYPGSQHACKRWITSDECIPKITSKAHSLYM
ncbi:MAG: hypothetical protein P8Z37_14915 [Acidobacteriota bacterium]|jgi:hypothetical protein